MNKDNIKQKSKPTIKKGPNRISDRIWKIMLAAFVFMCVCYGLALVVHSLFGVGCCSKWLM